MITFKQRVQRRNLWFTQTNQKRTLLGEHTVGFHIPFNHVHCMCNPHTSHVQIGFRYKHIKQGVCMVSDGF